MKKTLFFLSIILIVSGLMLLACEEQSDHLGGCDENDTAEQKDDAVERKAEIDELLLKSNEELIALVESRHEMDESPIEAEMGHADLLTKEELKALREAQHEMDNEDIDSHPYISSSLPYDNVNPETSSCKNTAKTVVKPVYIYGSEFCNGKYLGTLELRYSTACRTVWARLRAIADFYEPGDWAGAECWIHRNSDGRELRFSHRSSDGKTVWTNMLNDKNVTSYARGGIDSICGTIDKRTQNY